MAVHRSKLGPIPDHHWENEPTPISPAERRRAYGKQFLDDFDAKTEEIRRELEFRLGRKFPPPRSRARE
jgi:hypothetical protein